jgi:hypothetical protein
MLKVLLLCFLVSFSCHAQETSNWILAKEQNTVRVYTRTMPNSNYQAFKGKVSITGDLSELLSFIKEPKNCPNWQYRCLYKLPLNKNYSYQLNHLPWPLSNRYTVMKSDEFFNTQTHIYMINLKNIHRRLLAKHIKNQLPDEGNTVQMRIADGYWKLDASHAPRIDITYQMHGDPAGIIPASLANLGVINAAFVSLDNLRRHFALKSMKE